LNQGATGYFKGMYEMIEQDVLRNGNRTPLAGALTEAKSYLDAHKAGDTYKNCRKKFVIFLTDGWDTLACGANYDPVEDTQGWGYKRRRTTVTAAKALADAGYKVFVIGFGSDMPSTLRNTLNWAAYFGGTDNPDEINVGSTASSVFGQSMQ
jgi:Mg-chelatase subunit ChlD